MALCREDEVRHLNQADTHVADSERRITQQMLRVEELRRDGHDTREAERMLATLEQTLRSIHEHRAIIISTIRGIDEGRF